MPNAIGTEQIGISFGDELVAAGLGGLPFSWDTKGNFVYGQDMTTAQVNEVQAVYAEHNPNTANLLAYSEKVRYDTQCLGIDYQGLPLQTDPASASTLSGLAVLATNDSTYTAQWKFADGTFQTMTAEQIIAMGTQGNAYVQTCFDTEAALSAGIQAVPPTITTQAEIDAAYAAIATPPMRKRHLKVNGYLEKHGGRRHATRENASENNRNVERTR